MEERESVQQAREAGVSGSDDSNPPMTRALSSRVAPAQDEASLPEATLPEPEESRRFIYAIGTIEARFPTLEVEKEFAQAVQGGQTASLTDRQVLHGILSQDEYRYLAREVCWVFTVERIDTYILVPRTERELAQLVEAIKPVKEVDIDVVIGVRGPIAPPDMCNALQVPIVVCDRLYSFNIEEFVGAIPKPDNMQAEPFGQASRELFFRIQQLSDNVGATDEHRALNYVVLRYPVIYAHTMDMFAKDRSLASVEVRPSRLSGTRRIVQVVFSYVNRNTDVIERYFTRVDVTGKFPFLVSPFQPFYDR